MFCAFCYYHNSGPVAVEYQYLEAAIVHTFTPACLSVRPPNLAVCVFCCNRASLSDQLKVEDLWVPFRKIACEKMPAAVPDFFKASHTIYMYYA